MKSSSSPADKKESDNNSGQKASSIALLKSQGVNVSQLRTKGFSPEEIRLAGYSLKEMHPHLGMHRLIEAGFTLKDFLKAYPETITLREIGCSFPFKDILQTAATLALEEEESLKDSTDESLKPSSSSSCSFPLKDLYQAGFPPEEIRSFTSYQAIDFLRLGKITCRDLLAYGFTPEEIQIAETLYYHPNPSLPPPLAPPLPSPGPMQPPHASTMVIGEHWKNSTDYLTVDYYKVDPIEAEDLLMNHAILENPYRGPKPSNTYGSDGSGKTCPACGHLWVLLEKSASANDMRADEIGKWICDNAKKCGMVKEEIYTGYGSIFE